MTDYWVVGKKSDQRELYVILNQKNANLIEVNGMSWCTNTFSPQKYSFDDDSYTVYGYDCELKVCNDISLSCYLVKFFSSHFLFFGLQKKLRGFAQHSLIIFSSWIEDKERGRYDRTTNCQLFMFY